jgi:hypothetical protein
VQISAKTLIKPFNAGLGAVLPMGLDKAEDNDILDVYTAVNEDEEGESDEVNKVECEDNGVDEMAELSEDEREQLLEDTATVRETVTKASLLA